MAPELSSIFVILAALIGSKDPAQPQRDRPIRERTWSSSVIVSRAP